MAVARTWAVFSVGLASCVALASVKGAEPEPAAGSGSSSIASAKRDFEAVKSSKTEAARGLSLSRTSSVPMLETESTPVLSPIQQARKNQALLEAAKKRATKNWLVDAVEQEKLRSSKDRDGEGAVTQGRTIEESAAGHSFSKDSLEGSEPAHRRELPVQPDRATNPLQHYMAQWLTTKDFALLGPRAGSTEAEVNRVSTPDIGVGGLNSVPLMAVSPSHEILAKVSPTLESTTVNPYLSTLMPPAAPVARTFELGPNSSISARSPDPISLGLWSVAPSPPEKKTDEPAQNSRASDDAKYFRQLKRF